MLVSAAVSQCRLSSNSWCASLCAGAARGPGITSQLAEAGDNASASAQQALASLAQSAKQAVGVPPEKPITEAAEQVAYQVGEPPCAQTVGSEW